ncbi:MAG: alpha/beta hydrolase [Deltaproteobacteria bacterium]|nr:alpha/beta hydrolase [Deltaproteobacteria bacterium]
MRWMRWILFAASWLVAGGLACGNDGAVGDASDVAEDGGEDVAADGEVAEEGGEDSGTDEGEADGGGDDGGAEADVGGPCDDPDLWRDCFVARAGDPAICGTAGEAELLAAAARGFERREFPVVRGGEVWFAWEGSATAVRLAGDFDDWAAEDLVRVCATDLYVLYKALAADLYEYRLVIDGTWMLDPANRGFAYNDFAGKNSVVDLPGSGRGHLEWWPEVASPELGNSRDVFVYLPPDYDAEGTNSYPALYLHDGQNVFDDSACCFGNGGWEVNLAIDALAAAGSIDPPIVVGAANTDARISEYTQCAEMSGRGDDYGRFVVETLVPLVEAHYRIDAARRALAGSSLGGNISFVVAMAHPAVFRQGIGSMSGAFWVCDADGSSVLQSIAAAGFPLAPPLPVYIDSGGSVADNSDGAADSVAVRDALAARGWTSGVDLFYHLEEGAPHSEPAWRARVPLLLGDLFPR